MIHYLVMFIDTSESVKPHPREEKRTKLEVLSPRITAFLKAFKGYSFCALAS